MAPSKKVVASLVALLVLDNKEKQEKVKKEEKMVQKLVIASTSLLPHESLK
jgi:hypothetical protein